MLPQRGDAAHRPRDQHHRHGERLGKDQCDEGRGEQVEPEADRALHEGAEQHDQRRDDELTHAHVHPAQAKPGQA